MMRRLARVAALVVISACGHAITLTHTAPATWDREPGGHESARVTRVIDGDTIEVEVTAVYPGAGAGSVQTGGTYDVRLIGIDTPESVAPGRPIECFGRESSDAAAALLSGEEVRLVKDVDDLDRYGRLLRYVYIGEEMANARLVVNGYAHAYTYPPDVRHAALFVELQRTARGERRGLWADGACAGEAAAPARQGRR